MTRLLLVLGLVALPAVASAQQPETIEYYGTDAIGSIRIVWDASGNVIARQDFTPFGEPVLQQGTAIPREGFGGNESDAETDQDYFHARMFEARSGRFTRTDSIEDGVAEPQRWNRYAYGLNNPLSFTDAGGLNADPCAGTNYQTGSCVTAPFINPDWSFGGDWTDMFSAESGGWAAGLSSDQDGRQRGSGATTTTTTTTTSTPTPPNRNPNPNPQTPNETCRAVWTKGNYGNIVNDDIVPEFSAISIASNLREFAKSSAIALAAKVVFAGGPSAYGKLLSATAKNMAAYPGLTTAAADTAEKGLFWANTGAAVSKAFGTVGTAAMLYATGVDALARFECRTVN